MDKILSGEVQPPSGKWYLMSICSPKNDGTIDIFDIPENSYVISGRGCQDFVCICFGFNPVTIDRSLIVDGVGIRPFEEIDAQRVIDFVNNLQEMKEDVTLLIHRDDIVNRAEAIAKFISGYVCIKAEKFDLYDETVYNMLVRVASFSEEQRCEMFFEYVSRKISK